MSSNNNKRYRVLLMSFADPDIGDAAPPAPTEEKHAWGFEEVSETAQAYIKEHDLGAGNFKCWVFDDFEQIGRVSYNGKIWNMENEVICLDFDEAVQNGSIKAWTKDGRVPPSQLEYRPDTGEDSKEDLDEKEPIIIEVNPEFENNLLSRLNRMFLLHSGEVALNRPLFAWLSNENFEGLIEALERAGAGERIKVIYVQNLIEGEPEIVKTAGMDWIHDGDEKTPIELGLLEWEDLGYSFDEEPAQSTDYWTEIMFKRNGREIVLKNRMKLF